jgi:hypothetical protein
MRHPTRLHKIKLGTDGGSYLLKVRCEMSRPRPSLHEKLEDIDYLKPGMQVYLLGQDQRDLV